MPEGKCLSVLRIIFGFLFSPSKLDVVYYKPSPLSLLMYLFTSELKKYREAFLWFSAHQTRRCIQHKDTILVLK